MIEGRFDYNRADLDICMVNHMNKLTLRPNPFRPDKPIIEFDLFAGRSEELTALVESLYQTGNGNPRHMIVTGPRGIGKSSFINQIESIVEDSRTVLNILDIDAGDFGFSFAVFKFRAIQGQSLHQIVSSLLQKLPTRLSRENFRDVVSDFLKKWKPSTSIGGGLVGLEYQPDTVSDLSYDFVKTVRNLWNAIKNEFDGVILIIDEVDTIASNTNIASFLKVTTEEFVESGLDRIAVFLVGITGAMESLKQDHPSIARIFETIELLPLNQNEARDIIDRALSGTDVEMQEEVANKIVQIASGFPSPIHQLGYHAYKIDTDNVIDENDLELALDEMVGRIRREDLSKLLREAGSGDYRRIMIAMANHDQPNVPLNDIGIAIGRKTNEMSSYMTKLVNDQLITKVDRALYKITDPLLKLYIRKLDILEPELPYEDLETAEPGENTSHAP